MYLYELKVKHLHNISAINEKLKLDEHSYIQNKNQKITK